MKLGDLAGAEGENGAHVQDPFARRVDKLDTLTDAKQRL
jgi:hypothetical protein